LGSNAGVVAPAGIVLERLEAAGGIEVATGVARERLGAGGVIGAADHRQVPRIPADERIARAKIVNKENAALQNVACGAGGILHQQIPVDRHILGRHTATTPVRGTER